MTRLLDLTRSLRRTGRIATGVDRVEHAYLDQFLADQTPVFAVMRTAFGYVLLDRDGMAAFQARLLGQADWGDADFLSRLPRGRTKTLSRAETFVRSTAIARGLPSHLRRMLTRHLPVGFGYFNVGHSNLTDRMLQAVRDAKGQIHALIHDVIPLEYPQFQRPGTIQPFEAKLRRVSRLADRVIYNSHDTQKRSETQMQPWGRVPPSIVAHLGITAPIADASTLPAGLPPEPAYFVTVGTIEPRKNHAFLLDLWADMGDAAPPLLLCGTRGWNNDAVFERLDALPKDSPIKELPGLSDPALAALIKSSAGVLFPSLAEGYGLPPAEALQLGARVLCNDLPALREFLSNSPSFIPFSDKELWLQTIRRWEINPPDAVPSTAFESPTWAHHFKVVLTST
ncbi:MAG: glycosyltransferase [Sulfitobacter sp.]